MKATEPKVFTMRPGGLEEMISWVQDCIREAHNAPVTAWHVRPTDEIPEYEPVFRPKRLQMGRAAFGETRIAHGRDLLAVGGMLVELNKDLPYWAVEVS